MKKWLIFVIAIAFMAIPMTSFATMGNMGMKSGDVEGKFFGRVKIYPHYVGDVNFNKNGYIKDENGTMAGYTMRDEVRLGWIGGGKDWTFKIALEADLVPSQKTVDRGDSQYGESSGANFGVEKLAMTYNLGPVELEAGWDDRFLDINTSGMVYGDDHPFIGLRGKLSDQLSYELLYITYEDDADTGGTHDLNFFDWQLYTAKVQYKLPNGFVVSPFYCFSDMGDNANDAKVSYIGAEAYGNLGLITPRLELVYATGDTDKDSSGKDYDISAWAGYASVDLNLSPAFVPYLGIVYQSGDDDANDDDIEVFEGPAPISRYTPTFGMENALIYRIVPSLGSFIYMWDFNMLGSKPGYGSHYQTKAEGPGLIMYGLGAKGKLGKFAYKVQAMLFTLDETGALEDVYGHNIDDTMGIEYDLWFKYQFNKHFSIGNCLSVFDPDDAIEDIYGSGYDETAILNTVEFVWAW